MKALVLNGVGKLDVEEDVYKRQVRPSSFAGWRTMCIRRML